MVSRGGRSKGCSDCRRRRVKCDERYPICGQCAKRDLNCQGPKGTTWINQNELFTKKAPEIAASQSPLPVQLSFVAFEENICFAYTRKNLLRGGPIDLACNMVDSYERAEKFIGNPGRDLLRKSMLSLSLTFFGAQHRQAHITSKGYHRYGEVLQQLNSHLTQPKQQLTDETLLTALSCMLLEVFRPTGATNFLKHQRGIDAIMQLRGPPTDSAGTSALIFRGLRILSIIGALAESRTSLFSRKEWKQAPPAETTEAGMLQHQMFDVLADCTKLISQRDGLLASGASREDFEPLVAETSTILRNLEDIHLRWESLNRSQLADTEIVSRVARELGVANHISATAYMLYNTVYICILQIKDSLCPSSDNTTLRNAAASKIARCLKLKAEEVREGALRSSTIAFVATKVAWQALGKFDSPEGRNLAYIVQSAMYGIFQEPCTKREAKTLTETPTPNKTFFA